MDTLKQAFDQDTHSTQQRQRRFSRTNSSRSQSGKSKSPRQRDQFTSKFWVKDLKIQGNPRYSNIQLALIKNIDKNGQWSPPKRKPTPAKAQKEKTVLIKKEQLIQMQSIQIKQLNEQIDKYHIYIQRQNQRLQVIVKQNARILSEKMKIQQSLVAEAKKNMQLQKQIESLSVKISQKDLFLDIYQKQQSSLQKVKACILQNRISSHQRQKQQLKNHIRHLQKNLQNQKLEKQKLALFYSNYNYSPLSSHSRSNTSKDFNFFEQNNHLKDIEKQLYKSRQQVKRLLIMQDCIQIKHSKQLKILRQNKQKQYKQLKSKFTDFLQKYKLNMMKITSTKLRNSKSFHVKRSQSIESMESLMLSSDEQVEQQQKNLDPRISIALKSN